MSELGQMPPFTGYAAKGRFVTEADALPRGESSGALGSML